ncbi:uncharacterized protein L201_003115 [Kwoniella dendrophila CBS 6074]|uniref:DNA polymerase delta subunit 3 n=1 Tax=Kwoniella dendrophila CBS 6074 TaxID=1295534 RepID=A0AAX4JS39_9TREE
MASPEQHKIAIRKLSQWIENDRRIVTYRDISREVGCHVNVAKNLLYVHYKDNEESVSPTYLLTGPLLKESKINQTELISLTQIRSTSTQKVRIVDMDEMSEGDRNSEDEDDHIQEDDVGNDKGELGGLVGNSDLELNVKKEDLNDENSLIKNDENVPRWGVVLVGKDNFEEKKLLFEQDTLNIHIHSLAPSPVTDPAQYLIPNLTLRQHEKYHNSEIYGTISGESLIAKAAEKKPMKDGGMDWSSSKKVTGGTKKDENTKKKDELKKEEVKKVDTKKQSPFTSTTTPSAKLVSTTATNIPSSTTKAAAAASSSSTPVPAASGSISGKKKRIITSDTEEDEPAPKASSSGSSKSKKAQPTSSMIRASDDQKAMEAMMSMDMDVDLSDDDSNQKVQVKEEPFDREKPTESSNSTGKTRKTRRVKKSRTVEDKKGRMVTKDYSTDESYTASETDEPPTKTSKAKPKTINQSKPPIKARDSTSSIGSNNERKTPASSGSHPAPVKKASGGSAPKGQSTLKGFFTKK